MVSIAQRTGQPSADSVTPNSASRRALAGLGAAAVAPHRGDDEWAQPQGLERIDRRAGDFIDTGNPAAADG